MADAFVILSESFAAPHLALYVSDRAEGRRVHSAVDRRTLRAAIEQSPSNTRLIAFCCNTIVPASMIDRLSLKPYNIHPGSPDFPGVHPDAFAFALGARRYGATAHELTAAIDAGTIVATADARMPKGAARVDYGNTGFTRALDLYRFIVNFAVARDDDLPPLKGVAWRGRRNTLADYRAAFGDAPAHAPDIEALANAA